MTMVDKSIKTSVAQAKLLTVVSKNVFNNNATPFTDVINHFIDNEDKNLVLTFDEPISYYRGGVKRLSKHIKNNQKLIDWFIEVCEVLPTSFEDITSVSPMFADILLHETSYDNIKFLFDASNKVSAVKIVLALHKTINEKTGHVFWHVEVNKAGYVGGAASDEIRSKYVTTIAGTRFDIYRKSKLNGNGLDMDNWPSNYDSQLL